MVGRSLDAEAAPWHFSVTMRSGGRGVFCSIFRELEMAANGWFEATSDLRPLRSGLENEIISGRARQTVRSASLSDGTAGGLGEQLASHQDLFLTYRFGKTASPGRSGACLTYLAVEARRNPAATNS